jgi:hypothetical protein
LLAGAAILPSGRDQVYSATRLLRHHLATDAVAGTVHWDYVWQRALSRRGLSELCPSRNVVSALGRLCKIWVGFAKREWPE